MQANRLPETIVVKVGTSTMAEELVSGRQVLDEEAFRRVGRQVRELAEDGHEMVIVSSAAIAAGMAELGMAERPSKLTETDKLQGLAAIGNVTLFDAWRKALLPKVAAQLLLTKVSLTEREYERSQAVRTIDALRDFGAIPVVNENDVIATDEIKYGDNDQLSAVVAAQLVRTGRQVGLVVLSDIEGLYRDSHDPDTLISVVRDIDEAEQYVQPGAGTSNGTGGMTTKLIAARTAAAAGVDMWLAHGKREDAITGALHGKYGTHFVADFNRQ